MSGLFIKLDANFFSDDRIIECSANAQLLYIRCLCAVKQIETDGRLTRAQVRHCATVARPNCDQRASIRRLSSVIDELVQCGLWTTEDDNIYQITGWLKHNRTIDEINEIRAKRAVAGRNGGQRRGRSDNDDPENSPEPTKQIANQIALQNESKLLSTETETERKKETTTRDYRAKRAEDGRRGGRPKASSKDPQELEKSHSDSDRQKQSEHPLGNPKGAPKGAPKGNPLTSSSGDVITEAMLIIGKRVVKARGDGHKPPNYLISVGADYENDLRTLHDKNPELDGQQLADGVAPEKPPFTVGVSVFGYDISKPVSKIASYSPCNSESCDGYCQFGYDYDTCQNRPRPDSECSIDDLVNTA